MVIGALILKAIASPPIRAIIKMLPKIFRQGPKALKKLMKVEKKMNKLPGVKDLPEIKPDNSPKAIKEEVKQEIKKESKTEDSGDSKKLSEQMNLRAEARAAHANLLRTLAGNIEATKLNLAPEGDTEKIVAQLKGKEGEPESALATLSNTGKILSNQVQLGEAIQANNLAVAELAKTTADSDSADLLADRMDQMQEDMKKHMDSTQQATALANADSATKSKTLMSGIASGLKNTMGFMKNLPGKAEQAKALKDMLKDMVASYVEEASFLFNGIKALLEKIPIFKWIKKGIGAITGIVTKHVWPFLKKMGTAIKNFPKVMWNGIKSVGRWFKNKVITPIKEKLVKPVWNKIIKPIAKIGLTIAKFYPPITAILLIVKGIKALMKFFGKSKEQKEEEKKAKDAKKKAKEEAKLAKKAEKKAKQDAQQADQEKSEATNELQPPEDAPKEDNDMPDSDTLAKEGGVDVGDVDTEGVSEPTQVKDASEDGAMDGAKNASGSSGNNSSSSSETSDSETSETESEEDIEDGEVEESDAEESDAVSEYNEGEVTTQAEADQATMLAQERAALAANGGDSSNTHQTINIIQHTQEEPSNSYDSYVGG